MAFTSVIALSPALAIKPSQTQPLDMHGSGYGFYRTSEGYWEGTVWAHYDENGAPDNRQGVWEVGIEGIDWEEDPPSSLWYTMGFVDFEHFSGPILIAKGTFGPDAPEWPLSDLSFTYIANLKTMKWILTGPGFMFRGDIEVINGY